MIRCPQCGDTINHHLNNCPHCGYDLTDLLPVAWSLAAQGIPVESGSGETSFPNAKNLSQLEANEVAIGIEGNPHLVHLMVDQPIVLGRNFLQEEEDKVLIDLAALNAHEQGVSRWHARLEKIDNAFVLTDLGSANGTVVNNVTLRPEKPYLLKSSSLIRLGQLKMVLFFREKDHDNRMDQHPEL